MLCIRWAVAVIAVGALATLGCQEGPLSSEPADALQLSTDPSEIRGLIEALFEGGHETAMLKRFGNIERQLAGGQTHAAIAQGFALALAGPALRVLDVPPLFAASGRIGGPISSFSPFGAVDQASFDEGTAPEITSIDFPAFHPITAGVLSSGTVGFSDPDGDIVRAMFVEVSDPNGAFPGGFDMDPGAAGQTSGEFLFQVGCPADTPCSEGPVTLSAQLEDADGNLSDAVTFSFEIVDPSTMTTLVLNDSSLLHGQTATATASVTPAPEEGEIPMVRFVVDANTVNQQQVEKPLVEGQADATIFCDFLGGATSGADLEIERGTHTVRAFFLGTVTFDPSASATRFITCEASIG